MNSNQLMMALITTIEDQLNLIGVTSFEVSRNFQPSDQYAGADKSSAIKTQVFLHAITNPALGSGRRYNADQDKRADIQHLTKVFQVSVLHYFDYKDSDSITPEDMCATVRALLDSPDAIKSLRNKGVFLQEVGDNRPIFKVNNADQSESMPNFDFTVSYQSEIVKDSPYVDHVVGDTESV